MVIYLDVVLFENFIVNAFLLLLTCQSTLHKPKKLRLFMAAAFGSTYVLTIFFKSTYFLSLLPFKLLVAILMILITLGKRNLKEILKLFLLFMLYSMGLAGLCLFIQMQQGQGYNFDFCIVNFSYKTGMLCIMIGYIMVYFIVKFLKDRGFTEEFIYDVEMEKGGCREEFKAFLDTGNELKEPATGLPVILVERKFLDKLTINEDELYIIPYMVIKGDRGTLKAFRADEVSVKNKKNSRKISAMIAYCDNTLSKDGMYHALLSRGVFQ